MPKSHLGDVFEVDGRVEVRDLLVGQLAHGLAFAGVLENARLHHAAGRPVVAPPAAAACSYQKCTLGGCHNSISLGNQS